MLEVNALVDVVLSGLSAVVVEGVADEGELIRVVARTRDDPVPCPVCGTPTVRVYGFHGWTVAGVGVDGRRVVVVSVGVRRLVCPVPGCPRQTFREQVPAGSVIGWGSRHRGAAECGHGVADARSVHPDSTSEPKPVPPQALTARHPLWPAPMLPQAAFRTPCDAFILLGQGAQHLLAGDSAAHLPDKTNRPLLKATPIAPWRPNSANGSTEPSTT